VVLLRFLAARVSGGRRPVVMQRHRGPRSECEIAEVLGAFYALNSTWSSRDSSGPVLEMRG
jgi:hypothetical protein